MEIIYIVAGVIVLVLAFMVYHINDNHKASTKCTNALGNEFVAKCKTAPCECPTGYSSADWLHTTSCENKTLTMPYTNADGKKLQLINPMYGFYTEDNVSCSNSTPFRTECTSINNANYKLMSLMVMVLICRPINILFTSDILIHVIALRNMCRLTTDMFEGCALRRSTLFLCPSDTKRMMSQIFFIIFLE
jgi:hypothetical protein